MLVEHLCYSYLWCKLLYQVITRVNVFLIFVALQSACLSSAGSAVGCTATTDLDCQCTSSEQIQASAIDCVVSSCGFLAALAVQGMVHER